MFLSIFDTVKKELARVLNDLKSLQDFFIKHEMESAYKRAFLKSLTAQALVSEDGHFLAANATFCRMVEYSEMELQRMRFQDISDPEDVYIDNSESSRVAEGKIESYGMLKSYITKGKHLLKVKLRVDGVRDENGKFICFVAQVAPASAPFPNDVQVLVDIRTTKTLAWLHKNAKWILFIITGLGALAGYFLKEI